MKYCIGGPVESTEGLARHTSSSGGAAAANPMAKIGVVFRSLGKKQNSVSFSCTKFTFLNMI